MWLLPKQFRLRWPRGTVSENPLLLHGSYFGPYLPLRTLVELLLRIPKRNSKRRLGLSWGSGTVYLWAHISLSSPPPPFSQWIAPANGPGESIWFLGLSVTLRHLQASIIKISAWSSSSTRPRPSRM